MSDSIKDHRTLKWRSGDALHEPDHLAVEEPLEIRIGRQSTVTMRTPGHDEELAAGFLLAEGFINSPLELSEIRRLRDARGRPEPNRIDVILRVPSAELAERLKRNFAISSSCGLCGKTSIEAIERRIVPLTSATHIAAGALFQMPVLMREAQAVFSTTGGLHAAALFDYRAAVGTIPPPDQETSGGSKRSRSGEALSLPKGKESATSAPDEEVRRGLPDSEAFQLPNFQADPAGVSCQDQSMRLIVLREDVGRHNAVDKVIGYALLHDRIPLHNCAMMVSGRLSFEIVQKAAAAGIAILCAVSAPSSLAVELAEEVGMTLVGFLREPNLNIYTGEERIVC